MNGAIIVAVLIVIILIGVAYFLVNGGSIQKGTTAPNTQNISIAHTTTITTSSDFTTALTTMPTQSNYSTINASLSANPVTADWHGNVTTHVQGNYLVVKTNDVPLIAGNFPDKSDPNKIDAQNFTFLVPLDPQNGSHTSTVPTGGQIGIALDGVVFFGPLDANGNDAVKTEGISFDQCNGHPQQSGIYHYHEFSPCIVNSTPGEHSPLIGFAFDGYPIYGPDGANGIPVPQNSLDACNGHYDPEVGSYVYVATNSFPYLLGCYKGVPVRTDLASG